MYRIQNFTADAKQRMNVQLPDGTTFLIRLSYSDTQHGWYIVELTYGTFTLNGIRLVNAQNLLRQWRTQLPFGLFVTTPNSREALLVSDLASGSTNIYVLTAAEVAAYESYISGRS